MDWRLMQRVILIMILLWFNFRFFIHILMAYIFTLWTCYILYKEYANVAFMRLHFMASQQRRVDQFTVSTSYIYHFSILFTEGKSN